MTKIWNKEKEKFICTFLLWFTWSTDISLTFLHCTFSNVISNCLPEKRHICSSRIYCKMSVQIVCLEGCKVTLATFVWPSSSVFFKCVHKWQDQEDAKSHKMHLSDFSPFYIWVVVLFLFMNGEQMSQNMTSKMYVASLTFRYSTFRYSTFRYSSFDTRHFDTRVSILDISILKF